MSGSQCVNEIFLLLSLAQAKVKGLFLHEVLFNPLTKLSNLSKLAILDQLRCYDTITTVKRFNPLTTAPFLPVLNVEVLEDFRNSLIRC